MKKDGHPPYQDILFVDTATGTKFVCGSTLQPKEKETFEGKEYPVYRVPISSASHPFFTRSQQFVDSEGRVDKFRKRYARKVEENQGSPKREKKGKKIAASNKEKKEAKPQKVAKKQDESKK